MSTEDVDRYIERGYRNFKIVGRGLPQQFVLDSYLYFLVKDKERDFVRRHIVGTLQYLAEQQKAAMRR